MGQIIFNRKNGITCRHCSMVRIIWEYVCWVFSGRPDNHIVVKMKLKMKINWPLVGTLILFWGCVWFFGFFQTMMWSMIITASIGIYLRLSKKI